jgi:parvulin-like peptidyl-prolyl isomerase
MKFLAHIGLLLAGWGFLSGPTATATAATANGLVAIVDEEVITWKDVQQEAALTIESKLDVYRNRPAQIEKEIQKAQQEAVELLVEKKLILHEFKRAGYNLPDSLIEDRVRTRVRERWGGDRTAMAKDLHARGLTLERLREQERDRFIVAVMRSKNISQEIIISPFRIEKYYADHIEKYKVGNQVKLRTIMLNKPSSGSTDIARSRAAEIVTKLEQGATFAEMAAIYSEDSFRNQGGDRGWVDLDREHYQQELDQAIRALKPGKRSGVVDAGTAIWIVLVEETKANHTQTLPEVRAEIEETMKSQERSRLEKQWIERLKTKSFVRYF